MKLLLYCMVRLSSTTAIFSGLFFLLQSSARLSASTSSELIICWWILCSQAHVAYSTPPGSSTPSLPPPAPVSTPSPHPLPPPPSFPDVPAAVANLLLEFPDVVNRSKQLPVAVHNVQHHIKTVGPPLASRFCRLEGAKLQAARAEFDQMEKDGIVRPSTSPWASPLHMVPKKDSSWQPRGIFGSSTL